MERQMPKGFDNINPRIGRDKITIGDFVDVFEFPNKEWAEMRFLHTNILPVKTHWIPIITKDGKKTSIPKICLAWDPEKEEDRDGVECPYCDHDFRAQTVFYANAIIRDLQENKPRKLQRPTDKELETGIKSKKSKSWTPVRVVKVTPSVAEKIQKFKPLNKHVDPDTGEKAEFPVSHPKFGMNVSIMYDKDADGTDKYTVNSGEKNSLSKEERKYLVFDLSSELFYKLGVETLKEAKNALKGLNVVDDDEGKGKKKKRRDDEDDDDDDIDLGGSGKKKKRNFDDYGDEDDDFGSSKKKKKRRDDDDDFGSSKKKKRRDDDDDDDDFGSSKKKKRRDDDDDDSESSKKKKKRRDDDDDDDDFGSSKKKNKNSSAKKKKRRDDDDDFGSSKKKKRRDDDDFGSSKKKNKNSSAKKKKRRDDDDDDDSDF
jgi:hypothetical protein